MFTGFTDRDFDAYAPSKHRSNVFNRERLDVKQKLLTLGKSLAASLIAGDGSPLACEASVEHPALWNHKQVDAQHVYFSRNESARKELDQIIDRARPMSALLEDPSPQRNHLFLSITIDHMQVEVALKLHPDARIDRQNLERKLAEPWQRESFIQLVQGLPAGYRIGVTGATTLAAQALDDGSLRGLLADLARPELPGKTHWLMVSCGLPRASATATGQAIVDEVRLGLRELLPLYHFVAWSRDNDFVSMREVLRQEKQAKRQKGLCKNDRVRIVRGMFAGRQGVVHEVDVKGALRVLVGTVTVKVDAEEVEKA